MSILKPKKSAFQDTYIYTANLLIYNTFGNGFGIPFLRQQFNTYSPLQ